MIIGLTGTNSAGKGEVANYLKRKSFSYFSLSDEIRRELEKRGTGEDRDNLTKIGNEIRKKEGPAALAKRVIPKLIGDCIVDSVRNPAEVDELKSLPDFKFIAIDAPVVLRFERARLRGRSENADSLEKFKANEERENSEDPKAQQLNKTIALADAVIINDGTLEELHKKIEETLNNFQK